MKILKKICLSAAIAALICPACLAAGGQPSVKTSVKKGKIIRQRFKHVIPFSPRGVKTIIPGYIEGNADRSILRVHETDKITRVNTLTGEIAVETDASPPFISVGNDWRTYEKLLEQPILRE